MTGIGCGGATPTDASSGYAVVPEAFVGNNALPLARDTTLLGGPIQNVNLGGLPFLLVERALVGVDQRALSLTVAPGAAIGSARLELTIVANPITSGRARTIQLFRMTHAWSEAQATFDCAADRQAYNLTTDCAASDQWYVGPLPNGNLTNPWDPTPVATAQLKAGQGGALSFDVTASARAFAAGTVANNGWIIKSDDLDGGILIVGARESSTPPRLVITTGCAAGFGDCDLSAANGCEQRLDTPVSCGACGVSCDDSNPCTADSCGAGGVCQHTPVADGIACNDGNACTQVDRCMAGACTGGSPVTCAAADQCHAVGLCDPATGACSNPAVADGTACDDGNACTQSDRCLAGACASGTAVTCVSTDQCHVAGVCNPATGACSNPAVADGTACDDGNACTQADRCVAGACSGGSPVTCAAADQCHAAGICDPTTGACSNPAVADGTGCNDGNACTQADRCVAGACTGGSPVTCAAADQCHAAGSCDPASGACSNPAVADGTACNDGNACTQADSCMQGACTAGQPVVCPSADGCHPGVCDAATGACTSQVACHLYGVGTVPSSLTDGLAVSPLVLEDGASNNAVGGIGSAIAYTGTGNEFLMAPDRGPNAGDDSYTERYYVLDLGLGDGQVTPRIKAGAVLDQGVGQPTFTGRNIDFDATNSPASRRLDVEGLRVGPTGSFFTSDEYGPFVYEFGADGHRLRALAVPSKFLIDHPGVEDNELPPTNTKGRQSNRGMEGLAISPDGGKLYGLMQSPLIQDGALSAKNKRIGTNIRLLEIDTHTGQTREFLYPLEDASLGTNEILAISDHQFLVDERDSNGGTDAAFKKLFLIDIAAATDISLVPALPSTGIPASVVAVSKKLFLDLLDPAFGLAGASFPEKIEGMAFGPDLPDGRHTLVVTSDNDFVAGQDSKLFVFAIDARALPSLVAEQASFNNQCDGTPPVACPATDACHRDGMCNPGSGACSAPFEAAGKLVGAQIAGDCRSNQCDGLGNVVSAADSSDLPVDGNACTADVCQNGVPANPPVAARTACNQGGGSQCDGNGACVSCLTAADCGVNTDCAQFTCVAGACGVVFVAAGTPITQQVSGDCQVNQCDGAGGVLTVTDSTDIPNDMNACTVDVCQGGTPSEIAAPAGTSCGFGVCDGVGVCIGCVTAADCGDSTECGQHACLSGVCAVMNAPLGTPTMAQTLGDCLRVVCDGNGQVTTVSDDTDAPSDNNQCTADACAAGVPVHTPLAAGTACTQNGGATCDGAGACVAPTFSVVRVGDAMSTTALTSAATSVSIEQRRMDGSLVGTVSLPISASVSMQTGRTNQPFASSGTASSEGGLSLSGDGHYLVTAGYAATPGTTGVAGANASAIMRLVARIDAAGNVDTSTLLGTAAFSGNNVRGAAAANGDTVWVSGAGGNAGGGVWLAKIGTTGATQLLGSLLNNVRWIQVSGGQLYGTSNQTNFSAVFSIGAGLPIIPVPAPTNLIPNSNNASPFGFALVGGNTVYVADDRAVDKGGGVQKWKLSGSSWTQSATFGLAGTTIGFRGLAASVAGDTVTLIASTADSAGNKLVSFIDAGGSVGGTVIATAGANNVFRGVALSPK
ncbi:MAG TPA: esterase-like activity of phytase family protein [Polyangia bacterium]|nr:esterase-like activity of phytase family protein [Polyangia bacterium]